MNRPKPQGTVVLLAFACDPAQGSEPGAGWEAVRSASAIFDQIILITRDASSTGLTTACVDLPAQVAVLQVAAPLLAKSNVYVRYIGWVVQASILLNKLLATDPSIRVIHHVTYASDWLAAPVAFVRRKHLGRVRIVWGPVGGSTYAPRHLLSRLPLRIRAKETIRGVITRSLRQVTIALHRRTVDVAVALNADTERNLRGFPETDVSANFAFDPSDLPEHSDEPRQPVIVFAGRPLAWKGIGALIESVQYVRQPFYLDLYGGSHADFARFGDPSSPKIRVLGRVQRRDILDRLRTASALALPSFHDSAPWIAAEAGALGTRVICLNVGGTAGMAGQMAVQVDAGSGDLLPHMIAEAIDRVLTEDSSHWQRQDMWTRVNYESRLARWYGVE